MILRMIAIGTNSPIIIRALESVPVQQNYYVFIVTFRIYSTCSKLDSLHECKVKGLMIYNADTVWHKIQTLNKAVVKQKLFLSKTFSQLGSAGRLFIFLIN